jgi:hypothetical protein
MKLRLENHDSVFLLLLVRLGNTGTNQGKRTLQPSLFGIATRP